MKCQPQPGQVWVNNKTHNTATVIRVTSDRVIFRTTTEWDCCYELFIETYSIDVKSSIANLVKEQKLLADNINRLLTYQKELAETKNPE
jgi:hypothetical protein